MAGKKITALTALAAMPATGDLLPLVDISDTTDSAGGTTKMITYANLLGTALLAFSPLTPAAGKVPYFDGVGSAALVDSTSYGRSLLNASDAAALRTLASAQELDSDLTALAGNGTAGFWAAGTNVARTLVGTSNQVTVSNGTGAGGNPQFGLPQDIHTTAVPTFGGLLVSDLTSGRVPRATTSGRLVNSAYDTGSAFGYGTSPSYLAHFLNTTNATVFFTCENASTGASAAAGFAGISNSAFVSLKAYGSGNALGTYVELRASAGFLAVLLGVTERWRWDSSGHFTATEGVNIVLGTSTGTKLGTDTAQKLGFWNATPVVQQVLATGTGKTVDNVITFLQTIGLCKQS